MRLAVCNFACSTISVCAEPIVGILARRYMLAQYAMALPCVCLSICFSIYLSLSVTIPYCIETVEQIELFGQKCYPRLIPQKWGYKCLVAYFPPELYPKLWSLGDVTLRIEVYHPAFRLST